MAEMNICGEQLVFIHFGTQILIITIFQFLYQFTLNRGLIFGYFYVIYSSNRVFTDGDIDIRCASPLLLLKDR